MLFSSKRNKNIWYYLCFLSLFFVAALRNITVGTDTEFYIERYSFLDANSDPLDNMMTVKSEYLESFIYVYAHKIGLDFQYVLGVEALIFLVLCFRFYKKQLDNPSLGVFVLYCLGLYFAMFNGFRQSISMAVCLYAYPFLEGNSNRANQNYLGSKSFFYKRFNNIMFFVIVIIASFIHQASLILLLLYPLKYFKFKYGITFILLFVFFVLGIIGGTGAIVSSLVGFIWKGERFGSYLVNNESYIGVSNILNIVFLYAICYIFRSKIDIENNIYFKASVVELAIILLFSSSIAYMPRVVMPFTAASSILYSQCLSQKGKDGKFVMALVILKVFISTFLSGANGVIPYKFYWQ